MALAVEIAWKRRSPAVPGERSCQPPAWNAALPVRSPAILPGRLRIPAGQPPRDTQSSSVALSAPARCTARDGLTPNWPHVQSDDCPPVRCVVRVLVVYWFRAVEALVLEAFTFRRSSGTEARHVTARPRSVECRIGEIDGEETLRSMSRGWSDWAMRRTGFILMVCVVFSLVTSCVVAGGPSGTLPADGLREDPTRDRVASSATGLCPPILPFVGTSSSCSTFMLRTDEAFLIGHNLDSGRAVPGTIMVNKRGVEKTGVSLHELVLGFKPPNPAITWTSRYGSVTFNAWGKDFIDGGINEAGLYIHEMTLGETVFPEDEDRPRMFMMQWMQYQLDNYASVEEVLANLSNIVLDGWTWHFFVSDRGGNTAAVEFIDGEPYTYADESMPIPVLCNTAYPEELTNLEEYAGFGGKERVRLRDKNTARFVHAAEMIRSAPESVSVDYGFKILKNLERGGTQWSIVIDVNQGRVYFRTTVGRKMKYFDMTRLDFSPDTPVKMLDINAEPRGDVIEHFVDYSPELNRQATKEGIESTDSYEGGLSSSLARWGYDLSDLIDRACAIANDGPCPSPPAAPDPPAGVSMAEDAGSSEAQPPKRIWVPVGLALAALALAAFLLFRRNRHRAPDRTV